jgi:hypothetical protein
MSNLPPFGKRSGEAHIGVPVNEDALIAPSAPLLSSLLYEAGTMRTPIFSTPPVTQNDALPLLRRSGTRSP